MVLLQFSLTLATTQWDPKTQWDLLSIAVFRNGRLFGTMWAYQRDSKKETNCVTEPLF